MIVQGPIETFRVAFSQHDARPAAGADVRLFRHFSLVGDITLDMGGRQAFSSTRVTFGAGWRF